MEILQAISEADDGSCWSWVGRTIGFRDGKTINWWKEGREDGDGDGLDASVSQREIPYGDETVKYSLRKEVCSCCGSVTC